MADFLQVLVMIGAVLFPFVAMPLLWRRMKRVRSQAYREHQARDRSRSAAWEETVEAGDGLGATRRDSTNDELIELGDRGRHSRWPLDNV